MLKIDSNKFAEVVGTIYQPTQTVTWNGLEIIIKNTLSLTEVFTFVNNVIQMCFEDETGEYLPEVKDFAIKSCILDMYTNIELEQNVQKRYELIYCSDIIQFIVEHLPNPQLSEITHAIDVKLAHLAQANIESINKQMNDLYNAFDSFEKQIGTAFSAISEEDMNTLLSALTDKGLDEEKLVQAYLSQGKKDGKIIEMPKGQE